MTAKILQLANSAFMGARYTISNPTQAITLIGTEMVRALVLSVHVFSQFTDPTASDCTALWEHGIAVSCLCQRIAVSEKCSKSLVDECVTAGILHEIGKLVLLAEMPAPYVQVLRSVAGKPSTLGLMERAQLGCTHADLGAYLMSIWGLPHALVHAVAYHDRPSESIEDCFSSLTVVHAADAIVSSKSSLPIVQDVQLDDSYLEALGLTARKPVWERLFQQQMELATSRAADDAP